MRLSTRRWLNVAASVLLTAIICTIFLPAGKAAGSVTSITVWTASGVPYNWPKTYLADFTKQTGITVNYAQYPETSYTEKLQLAQLAKSTAYDVFMNPESETSTYLTQHAITPIKQFLDDKTLTPANFDFADIPSGEMSQCTLGGVLYCLPVFLDPGPQLFYNKAMFAAAGISSPPKTWAGVIADAKKLKAAGKDAMCMRGSEAAPNGYPVLLMLPYYLPYAKNYKGEYLDANWKPLWDTPQALKWATDYQTLMHNYAPKGVAAYDYADCQHAFQNGQVAMWWDNAVLGPNLYTPSMSKVAKSAGFDALSCPSWNANSCALSAPWGIFINPNVSMDRQQAGWKFLARFASKATQQKALLGTKYPFLATRTSTLNKAISESKLLGVPADFLVAIGYTSQRVEPNAIPVTPAFVKIQSQLFVVVSELITAQTNPAGATQALQSQMTSVLQQYNLLNP